MGGADASLQGLPGTLLDMTKRSAAVGTLIIRFGTLWFGVIIGLIAFSVLSRRLAREAAAAPDQASEAGEPVAGPPP